MALLQVKKLSLRVSLLVHPDKAVDPKDKATATEAMAKASKH